MGNAAEASGSAESPSRFTALRGRIQHRTVSAEARGASGSVHLAHWDDAQGDLVPEESDDFECDGPDLLRDFEARVFVA